MGILLIVVDERILRKVMARLGACAVVAAAGAWAVVIARGSPEPPDLFDGRLSARHAERAPKLVRKDSGIDVWAFMGAELPKGLIHKPRSKSNWSQVAFSASPRRAPVRSKSRITFAAV